MALQTTCAFIMMISTLANHWCDLQHTRSRRSPLSLARLQSLALNNPTPSFLPLRQWPEVSDFVARFCTLRESENTRTCENRTRFHARIARETHAKRVRFSHVRVFSDSRNVQKSVTQIVYLRPLPTLPLHVNPGHLGGEVPGHTCRPRPKYCLAPLGQACWQLSHSWPADKSVHAVYCLPVSGPWENGILYTCNAWPDHFNSFFCKYIL